MASVHRTRRSNQLDDGAPRTPPPAFGISMRGNRFVEPSGRCSGVLPRAGASPPQTFALLSESSGLMG